MTMSGGFNHAPTCFCGKKSSDSGMSSRSNSKNNLAITILSSLNARLPAVRMWLLNAENEDILLSDTIPWSNAKWSEAGSFVVGEALIPQPSFGHIVIRHVEIVGMVERNIIAQSHRSLKAEEVISNARGEN